MLGDNDRRKITNAFPKNEKLNRFFLQTYRIIEVNVVNIYMRRIRFFSSSLLVTRPVWVCQKLFDIYLKSVVD